MGIVLIQVKLNPGMAPSNPIGVSWKERLIALKDIWGMLAVFLIVMGGIYFGFFTATEAGAMGAFVLFIFVAVKRKMTWRVLRKTLLSTATVTCMIFTIFFGAYLFSDFMTLSRVPTEMMNSLTAISSNRYVIFLLIVVIYLILGCFIDAVPMIVLTVPIVLPVIEAIGFNPIWFGVIVVLMVQAACITPPVGMNVFVIAGIMKDVPMTDVFRGALPYVISILVVATLLAVYPPLATFLPGLMIK